MFRKFTIVIVATLCSLVSQKLQAQQLHFSQYFNNPLLVNPANTGFIPDADYRIAASYRNQWSSVMTVPYKTMSIFGDAQLFRERLENGWVGAGAVVLNDVAGSGSLTATRIYGSLAYHQMLGLSSLVSVGFNGGWVNKRIDNSKLKYPDQFDGKFFDNSLPTAVSLVNNNVSFLDVQAGVNYAYFPREDIYINAGYSVMHLNRPRETFFADMSDQGRIPLRHTAFLNAILKVHPRVIINPNAYYSLQTRSSELELGLNANYDLSGGGEKQLLAGLYYRVGDGIVPMVGLEIANIRLMFSYDVTVSGLSKYNSLRGASEFNLMKKGFYPENVDRASLCPKF